MKYPRFNLKKVRLKKGPEPFWASPCHNLVMTMLCNTEEWLIDSGTITIETGRPDGVVVAYVVRVYVVSSSILDLALEPSLLLNLFAQVRSSILNVWMLCQPQGSIKMEF